MNETKQDFYEILGVAKNSTQDDIKKAYRKLAFKYHPDRSSGNKTFEKKFKEINEAYSVLGDPKKRSAYDQFGHQSDQYGNSNSGGFNFSSDGFSFKSSTPGSNFNFNDIFSEIFGNDIFSQGRRNSKRYSAKGNDVNMSVEITIQEAFSGTTKTITSPSGTIELKIPEGIKNKQKLKIEGKGSPGISGGPSGNLYVTIDIIKSEIFERIDDDVVTTIKICFVDIILGTTVIVPTLNGKIEMKIPPDTQSDKIFRLKGKGFKISSFKRGDQLVKLHVELPKKLSNDQKKLLEAYKNTN